MSPDHIREVLNNLSGKKLREQCVGFQRPIGLRRYIWEPKEEKDLGFSETHGKLNLEGVQ